MSQILVVDDDFDIRNVLIDVLRDAGYSATGVRDGREALNYLLAQRHPSLILLDLRMPGMDGAQFCVEQQKSPELARIPVVLLTADGTLQDRYRPDGVSDMLKKPVHIDDLIATVGRYCQPESTNVASP